MSGASAHEVLSIRPNRSMSRFARGVLPAAENVTLPTGGLVVVMQRERFENDTPSGSTTRRSDPVRSRRHPGDDATLGVNRFDVQQGVGAIHSRQRGLYWREGDLFSRTKP